MTTEMLLLCENGHPGAVTISDPKIGVEEFKALICNWCEKPMGEHVRGPYELRDHAKH